MLANFVHVWEKSFENPKSTIQFWQAYWIVQGGNFATECVWDHSISWQGLFHLNCELSRKIKKNKSEKVTKFDEDTVLFGKRRSIFQKASSRKMVGWKYAAARGRSCRISFAITKLFKIRFFEYRICFSTKFSATGRQSTRTLAITFSLRN